MRMLAVGVLLLGSVMQTAAADGLRAGASAVSITPAPGTPMAGYYSERGADSVHDDLFAKALVLEKDGHKTALVALDLISTTRGMVEEARKRIESEIGIPGAHVMISATHSHTGPVLRGRGTREKDFGGESDLARQYATELPGKIARAVRLAHDRLTPAAASCARGREESIAYNRRFHMVDGTVGWNPGKLNPKILKPAGAIDPDVPVVYLATAGKDRKPIATYVNYAVHLDNIGGQKISADLPATLSKLLGEVHGPDMVTLWTAGCCGDINHINVQWGEPQKGFENSARMGIILAAEVLRAWPRLTAIDTGALRVKSAMVDLPLPKVTADEIVQAKNVVARRSDPKEKPPAFLDQVAAYKVLDVEARGGQPQQVEVQVVALGRDLAWVSLPGEIFVELGLTIKQDSPFPNTIIAELANGSIGYIPSRRAYPQGNYEVVSARCAEGSGELLVAVAGRLLRELYAENRNATAAAGE